VIFPAGSYSECGGTPVVDRCEALGRICKQICGQNTSNDALQVVVQENIILNHQTAGHFQPHEVPAHSFPCSFPTKRRRSHQQMQERKQSKESQKKQKKEKERSYLHINHYGSHNFNHTPPTLALGLPPLPP
jgi:hypothetical protein